MKPIRRRANWLALVAVVLAAVLAAGCATNPVTGKHELSLVTGQQELQIGREGYQAVLREYGDYNDPRLAAYVDSVGKRLAAVSHLPNLEWHFTLLDDPVVNAFAMPGGYIYVTRGILAHLNSEAQLAGVLGHEIGHVTARHTAQRITQQQIAGLGLGLASALSQTFQRYGGAAQQALGLLFLKYGRDDENQADQLGVDYAVKAGYDPREIPETYVMLRRVGEQAGQRIPAFLSTHPDPGDREARTRELAKAAAAGKQGLVIRGRDHVRRLDGVVFGNDPRQGYFEGTHFYHPELKIEITFPSGWKTQNTRQAVLAGAPDQKDAMQLTLVDGKSMSPSEYVDMLERTQRVAGSEGGRETIGGYAAWMGRIAVIRQDGTTTALTAGFIRKDETHLFQIVGQSAGDDTPIRTSIRSFRGLTDPARLAVEPAHLKVVTVAKTGAFSTVVAGLGTQAIAIEPLSILNDVEPDESVAQGTLLKLVPKVGR